MYIDTLGVPGIRIYRLNWSKQTNMYLKVCERISVARL